MAVRLLAAIAPCCWLVKAFETDFSWPMASQRAVTGRSFDVDLEVGQLSVQVNGVSEPDVLKILPR